MGGNPFDRSDGRTPAFTKFAPAGRLARPSSVPFVPAQLVRMLDSTPLSLSSALRPPRGAEPAPTPAHAPRPTR